MDIDFDDLPDDPVLAFIRIELEVRIHFEELMEETESARELERYTSQYISRVITTIETLGLHKSEVIPRMTATTAIEKFEEVKNACENFNLKHSIQNAKRRRLNTVSIDATTKNKLLHYLELMKSLIGQIDLPPAKKEAIIARILALESEISRDRTSFEAVGALFVQGCTTIGMGARKLAPLRKLMDSFGQIVADSMPEITLSLPKPSTKAIEPPKPPDGTSDKMPEDPSNCS